jgi:hypothetical protein
VLRNNRYHGFRSISIDFKQVGSAYASDSYLLVESKLVSHYRQRILILTSLMLSHNCAGPQSMKRYYGHGLLRAVGSIDSGDIDNYF